MTWANDAQEIDCLLPMLLRVETVTTENYQRLTCKKCQDKASFISPIGLLCKTHALLAAADFGWLPVQVREPRQAESKSGPDPDSWNL